MEDNGIRCLKVPVLWFKSLLMVWFVFQFRLDWFWNCVYVCVCVCFFFPPCGPAGCYENRLTVWSMWVIEGDRRVHGSWVGDPLSVSFFVLFFPSVLHLLWAHPLPGFRCGVLPSVPRSLFFFNLFTSFFFPSSLLSLALVRTDLSGSRFSYNSKYICKVLQGRRL